LNKQLGQIGTVLAGDAGDECNLVGHIRASIERSISSMRDAFPSHKDGLWYTFDKEHFREHA
jgi:hypothetical protein